MAVLKKSLDMWRTLYEKVPCWENPIGSAVTNRQTNILLLYYKDNTIPEFGSPSNIDKEISRGVNGESQMGQHR